MTYQEALNYLDNVQVDMKSIESMCDTSSFIETCKNALEKQIPKKPIYEEANKAWYCGECKRVVWVVQKHCEHCGQAIDWSDYK